jgi:hypothetical protein
MLTTTVFLKPALEAPTPCSIQRGKLAKIERNASIPASSRTLNLYLGHTIVHSKTLCFELTPFKGRNADPLPALHSHPCKNCGCASESGTINATILSSVASCIIRIFVYTIR